MTSRMVLSTPGRRWVALAVALVLVLAAGVAVRIALRPSQKALDDTSCEVLSVLECQNQVAVLAYPIAGTRFDLVYASDRVPGRPSVSDWDARRYGLGGWSLDALHRYDPKAGQLIRGDGGRVRVGKAVAVPGVRKGAVAVPDETGTEVYVFGRDGRHLRTLDALTNAVRLEFSYDNKGRLASVSDGSGNKTVVERDGSGVRALVAPFGQRTSLQVDPNGWLGSITAPSGKGLGLVSTVSGLVTEAMSPGDHTWRYQYDPDGRLALIEEPAGGRWKLARGGIGGGARVEVTSPTGATTRYEERQADGVIVRRQVDPGGAVTEARISPAARAVHLSDGTQITAVLSDDPRWGQLAPVPARVRLLQPSGLTSTLTVSREARLTDAANPLSHRRLAETLTWDGASYVTEYKTGTRQLRLTTPEGRTTSYSYDEHGRPASEQQDGLAQAAFTYDKHGRLVELTRGKGSSARHTRVRYLDGLGAVEVLDAAGQSTMFHYDGDGNLVRTDAPGGQVTRVSVDASDEHVAVSPPGRPSHVFDLDGAGRPVRYAVNRAGTQPEDIADVAYRPDGFLQHETEADGRRIDYGYDAAARLTSLGLERGRINIAYDPSGLLSRIRAPGNVSLRLTYDGGLPTGQEWEGPVHGRVTSSYGKRFALHTLQAPSGDAIGMRYDGDGLLTQAGEQRVKYDPASGLPVRATLGSVESRWAYDKFGDVHAIVHEVAGRTVFAATYQRDALGRITSAVEDELGTKTRTDYDYDQAGRLSRVTRDGSLLAEYQYDANGNRVTTTGPAGPATARYDSRDRLRSSATATYRYSPAGDLREVHDTSGKTRYRYDELGALTTVSFQDGRKIGYDVDGLGRRVAKRENGSIRQGFLYLDGLRPVAELDGSGTAVATYVHTDDNSTTPGYIIKDGHTYRVLTDQLGSPRLVVDTATGHVVQRLDYDPWGVVTTDTNTGFQPFGFAGGLYDPDTGLVRFGARDYDARTGRWTTPDPALFAGGDNLYAYASNDPVNVVDPTGHQPGFDDQFFEAFKRGWSRGKRIWGYYQLLRLVVPGLPGDSPPSPPPLGPHGRPMLERDPQVRHVLKETARIAGGPSLAKYTNPLSEVVQLKLDIDYIVCVIDGACAPPGGGSARPARRPPDLSPETRPVGDWREHCENVSVISVNGRPWRNVDSRPTECADTWGDPHLGSGDGQTFDLNITGEYVATRSVSDGFEIQFRFEPWLNTISRTTAVAARVGRHRVAVYAGQPATLRVDGTRTVLRYGVLALGRDGEVEVRGGVYVIRWADGSDVKITPRAIDQPWLDVSTAVAGQRLGKVEGLLGNFDGDPANDFATPTGKVLKLNAQGGCADFAAIHHEFAPAWLVRPAASLFDYEPGHDSAGYYNPAFPARCASPDDLPKADRRTAEERCRAAGIVEDALLRACILDVGLTGEKALAKSTADAKSAHRIPEVASKTTITTFDGLDYPLNFVGDFVFTQSLDKKFAVHVRTSYDPSAKAGGVNFTAVGALVGSDRITLVAGSPPRLTVNDRAAHVGPGPVGLSQGGRIESRGGQIVVVWPDHSELQIDASDPHALGLDVQVFEPREGKLVGLLGDWNGDQANDLTTAQGLVIRPADKSSAVFLQRISQEFAASWQVRGPHPSLLP